MYGYNPQINIDRINNQIQELEKLKTGFQTMPQQPITNIINTNNTLFEARILNENEKVDEILINHKTMFFDPLNGKLTIKEINGDTKEYDVILPKTEEQLRIEELERKVKEYESKLHTTNNKKQQSNKYDNEQNESTAKNDGTSISK